MHLILVGFRGLLNVTDSQYNTAFGCETVRSTTTGGKNVGIGAFALYENTTGLIMSLLDMTD